MGDLVFKPKRKPITYGKATRKLGYGRPLDQELEDELASMDTQISGKISKVYARQPGKGTSIYYKLLDSPHIFFIAKAKMLPSPQLTTPPISPSPSMTSPSSSIGTKRGSPFLENSSWEQSKRTRLASVASTTSLEEMFPIVEERKRKPVPKLSNHKASESIISTSDETQMLLHNQLQEFEPLILIDQPTAIKKTQGLKMPTRDRGVHSSIAKDTSALLPISRATQPLQAQKVKRTGSTHVPTVKRRLDGATKTATKTFRPRTPEKANNDVGFDSVISPSNLELEVLRISTCQTPKSKVSEVASSQLVTRASHNPSPFRPKLKDRLTSDLIDMMVKDSSTVEISLDSSRVELTPQVPTTSSRGNLIEMDSQPSATQANSQSSQLSGPKVTYGAAQWTFLPDDDDDDMVLLAPILDQDSNIRNKTTRQLPDLSKSISNLEAFDMDEDDDEEPTATMKSLHELKRAGGSQRINRQIEALLDDIDHTSNKTQKIGPLIELVSKLKQNNFLRQFLDSGSEARLLNTMDSMNDIMSRILYCTALLLIFNSQSLSTMSIEAESHKVTLFISKLLDQKNQIATIAKAKNSHVPKDGEKAIEKYYNNLRTSSMWPSYTPSDLTPQILGLTCLERLVRRLRESGYRAELLSTRIINNLVENLSEWRLGAENDAMLISVLSLSILESESLAYSLTSDISGKSSWSPQTGVKLIKLYSRLLDPTSLTTHGDLVSLALRLCLNLSNGNEATYSIFCNIDFIRSTLQATTTLFGQLSTDDAAAVNRDLTLDNLVLSLGLLINLSEKLVKARELFLRKDSGDETQLETLLQLFTSRLQEVFEVTSESEIRSNIPFGYLAVLLGYLCKTTAIFHQVRSRLEGGNLRLLLIAIGEFLQYHQKVEELKLVNGESSIQNNFIDRLQELLKELKFRDSGIAQGNR